MRRRSLKKQKKIIIVSSLCLLLCLCVGYAAFQTTLSIRAKGNIIDNSFSIDNLKDKVVSSGDGLYVDPVEENRYVYKGTNPDNYVTFNDDEAGWRIIAIESDGTLKLRKIESIGGIKYDDTTRNSSRGNYCFDSEFGGEYGCNVWGSKNTMLDANGSHITSMPWVIGSTTIYTLPDKEANMNVYLNTTYYNTLNDSAKEMIQKHYFNVGILSSSNTQTLETDVAQEKTYLWEGNVGVINATDYVRASTDSSCTSVYAASQGSFPCKNHNYLFNENDVLNTLSLVNGADDMGGPRTIWYIKTNGELRYAGFNNPTYSNFTFETYPVIYIKSDIKITGSGTVGDPYVLE